MLGSKPWTLRPLSEVSEFIISVITETSKCSNALFQYTKWGWFPPYDKTNLLPRSLNLLSAGLESPFRTTNPTLIHLFILKYLLSFDYVQGAIIRHCRDRREHRHSPYPHEANTQAQKTNIKQTM